MNSCHSDDFRLRLRAREATLVIASLEHKGRCVRVIFREVKCGSAFGVPRVSARHSAALEHGENPRLDILSAGQHSRLDREGRKAAAR